MGCIMPLQAINAKIYLALCPFFRTFADPPEWTETISARFLHVGK